MPRLREQLGLEGVTYNREWKELRTFIDKTTPSYIDLTRLKGPISRQRHQASIELIAQKVCTAFASLFSNPKTGKGIRVLLENYIITTGNEVRHRRKLTGEKHHGKPHGGETRDPPPHSTHRTPSTQQHIETAPVRGRGYRADQGDPTNSHGGGYRHHSHHEKMKVEPEPVAIEPSPPPPQVKLRYPPIPGLSTSDSEDELTLKPNRHKVNVEHEGIHDFLASCKPCLTHLYPYLVGYGCTDTDYLKVMSEWSDSDLQAVFENVKTVKVVNAKPVKPMDWDILRHFIRKLKVL
ncbi:hypothetical protein BDN72DRAFT_405124 [Pluteus cervinus]|uniref:Uncharacterized protein n=1 Tax=Pluteus cervinus TaxID=181527 RepID=A0ACD3A8Y9_9AGAR|nr:hypothetical protein BDN72DRAFT_405124 [Pluteus cervinus]